MRLLRCTSAVQPAASSARITRFERSVGTPSAYGPSPCRLEIVEGMTAATHGLLDYLRKQLTFNVAMRKKIKNIKHDDTDNDGDQ